MTRSSRAAAWAIGEFDPRPGLGLVDASVVALAESLDVRRLATRDVGHFAAARLRNGRSFELVVDRMDADTS
jgi:hypothetical protein